MNRYALSFETRLQRATEFDLHPQRFTETASSLQ
jgi:hypothetical protein